VSGDALDADKRRAVELTGAPFLTKPFDLAEVHDVVRRKARPRVLLTNAPRQSKRAR
jgi:hypothetical protein